MSPTMLRKTAVVTLVALIALCLAWELWLAPLRPGGSRLALKALPLTLPLAGVLAGRRYTYQWASLLMIIYFVEGVTRSWTDEGLSRVLALTEIALSITFVVLAIVVIRRPPNPPS